MRATIERANTDFCVDDYLQSRINNDAFTMVEFGHDTAPVEACQPFSFEGERRYYGFENWIEDPYCEAKKASIAAKNDLYAAQGMNISFMEIASRGAIDRDPDDEQAFYSGTYMTETPLENSCADEVLISNVFGDPLVRHSLPYGELLLSETKRLLKPGGFLVVRETITPRGNNEQINNLYKKLGLSAVREIVPDNPRGLMRPANDEAGEQWLELESIYSGQANSNNTAAHNSYVLFVQKTD